MMQWPGAVPSAPGPGRSPEDEQTMDNHEESREREGEELGALDRPGVSIESVIAQFFAAGSRRAAVTVGQFVASSMGPNSRRC